MQIAAKIHTSVFIFPSLPLFSLHAARAKEFRMNFSEVLQGMASRYKHQLMQESPTFFPLGATLTKLKWPSAIHIS